MSWECVHFYHIFIFGWITPLSKKTVSGNVVRVEYTMDLVINTFISAFYLANPPFPSSPISCALLNTEEGWNQLMNTSVVFKERIGFPVHRATVPPPEWQAL